MADKKYIEKQAAIELLRDNINLPIDSGTARAYWTRVVEIKDALIGHIAKIPAADVAEVVHAEWVMIPVKGVARYRCGNIDCCRLMPFGCSPVELEFCPHCGAHMDGGKNEEI